MKIITLKKFIVDMDVVKDVTCRPQSFITRVCGRSHDFYDTTLSTE